MATSRWPGHPATSLYSISWQLLLIILYISIQKPDNTLALQDHQPTTNDDISSNILNESSVLSPDSFPLDDWDTKCQPMRIKFCEKVKYNKTILPNKLGHKTQQDVESEINIYYPLVNSKCSDHIEEFICTVYAPICFDHDHESELKLEPCRSLCESVRQGCTPTLRNTLKTEWPRILDCSRFPDGRQKDVLCVGNDSHIDFHESEASGQGTRIDPGFVCPKNFEVNSYTLHFNGKTYNNCAMPCENVYLDKSGTNFVRIAVAVMSIVCLIASLLTCTTFLIDTERFQYPARPIIIIAFCQLVVALCYLIGFSTSNQIACNDPAEPPKSLPNMKMIRTLTMGNKKGSCTLLFMTLYFFQISAVLWWLMMTISWYMIAKLKWAPEAVSGVARYFHFTSWTIPALFTVYLAVLGDIEGDSLSGTCFVSSSNQESIRLFLIIPTAFCLAMGVIFLMVGYKSIWECREVLRSKYENQADEHYKLVIRIGFYSLLFIVFTATFILTHYYEQDKQTLWKLSWLSNICKNRDYSIPCPSRNYSNQGPHYIIFMIKYFSSMAIGLVSAGFIQSEKTAKAYKEVAEMFNYRLGL